MKNLTARSISYRLPEFLKRPLTPQTPGGIAWRYLKQINMADTKPPSRSTGPKSRVSRLACALALVLAQTQDSKERTSPIDAPLGFASGWRTADMPLSQMDARQADATSALRRDLRQIGMRRATALARLLEAPWVSAAGTLFLLCARTSHGRLKKRLRREHWQDTERLLLLMRPWVPSLQIIHVK